MLTLAGGANGRPRQHQALFSVAGLRLETTHLLPTGFVAYELCGEPLSTEGEPPGG